jgi:hypothetical protein
MKIARVCLLFLCLSVTGWSDFPKPILEIWNGLEKSFSGTRWVSVHVFDQADDLAFVEEIQRLTLRQFESFEQEMASQDEYDLEDSQLGIFIAREKGMVNVSLSFQVLIDSEPELFFFECFSADEETAAGEILHRIDELLIDMIHAGCSFKVYLAE